MIEGGGSVEGTLVSSITAQRIPVDSMAARRLLRVSWWYSWEPWEKLKRATFMPARRSFSTMGTDLDAGPRVHTILVLGFWSISDSIKLSLRLGLLLQPCFLASLLRCGCVASSLNNEELIKNIKEERRNECEYESEGGDARQILSLSLDFSFN